MFPLTCLNKSEGTNSSSLNLQISTAPLTFSFSIISNEPPFVSDLKGPNIWGLWEYDVVEVFLQPRNTIKNESAPYFEFQLSPKSQKFSLEVLKPRIQFFSPLDIRWTGESNINENSWYAEFHFDDPLFKNTTELYFGAYAILGKDNRNYYSLDPFDSVIDFHRPKKFHNISSYLL